MPVKQENREMVTDHVVVRWLERVEGYDFDEIRSQIKAAGKRPTDTRILQQLANQYGLFRGHVIFRIATKAVTLAIKAGAKKVHRGDWTLIINDGRVVTLVPRQR